MYNGILVIYKEAGFTSHDVVAKLRGILKQKKIGHTGTLDPDAVGVLPVCLGSGTKLCDFLTDQDKEYTAVLKLGLTTYTQDTTGKVLYECPVKVNEEEIQEAIFSFGGCYQQIPPMYSAIKIKGKKLYEIARAGGEIKREPRLVEIRELEILGVDLPEICFRIACSKGTYIRTLCHDIGEKLGCGGAMAALERTRAGAFLKKDALTLSEVEELERENKITGVIKSVDTVFSHLRAVVVPDENLRLVQNGNRLKVNQTLGIKKFVTDEVVRIYDENGAFYALYKYRHDELKPEKMFFISVKRFSKMPSNGSTS